MHTTNNNYNELWFGRPRRRKKKVNINEWIELATEPISERRASKAHENMRNAHNTEPVFQNMHAHQLGTVKQLQQCSWISNIRSKMMWTRTYRYSIYTIAPKTVKCRCLVCFSVRLKTISNYTAAYTYACTDATKVSEAHIAKDKQTKSLYEVSTFAVSLLFGGL